MADSCDETSLQKLKVAQLKKLLEGKGLPSGGNKPELISRLVTFHAKGLLDDSVDKDIPEDDSLLDDTLLVADNPVDIPVNKNDDVVSSDDNQLSALSKPEVNSSSSDAAAAATKSPPASQNKFESRLKRFGVVSETARKAARSERFQNSSNSAQPESASNGDAIKKRAERFGLINGSPEKANKINGASNDDAIKKRAERFGLVNAVPEKPHDGELPVVPGVEQLKKRAERFGQVTSSSLTKVELQDRLLKRKQRFDGESAKEPSSTTSSGIELDEPKQKRLQRFGAVSV